jgi:hypothetical protein
MSAFMRTWAILKEEISDERFKQIAWGGMDEGWNDHLDNDFDYEKFDNEEFEEIIDRKYPTHAGYSPGLKELKRSLFNRYESQEENDMRFNDLMENEIREPIIILRTQNGDEVIAGHHRMAASIEAGRETIPALILNMDIGGK